VQWLILMVPATWEIEIGGLQFKTGWGKNMRHPARKDEGHGPSGTAPA
jgi:hypothetical protein